MYEFQSSQLTFPANRESHYEDKHKPRSPSESIDMDDEEAVYWQNMKPKIDKSLKLIRSVGLPIIRFQASPLPGSIRDLIFKLREEDNPTETKEFKLLISGLIEGQIRSPIFKLTTQIQAILEDRQFEVEFDSLMNVITEISTYTNNASEGTIGVKEMFSVLQIKLPEEVDVNHLTTCAHETFTVKDHTLLSYWIPITMIQQVVKIRDFIEKSIVILKQLVVSIDSKDYDESSKFYLQYMNLKKSYWQPQRISKVKQVFPEVSIFTPKSSKKSARKQKKSSNLTNYFTKLQSKSKQPQVNEGSLFKQLGFKVDRKSNFDVNSFEGQINQSQNNIRLPQSRQSIISEPQPFRKVYLHLHDSSKELRGLLIETKAINPRNPLQKFEHIDYEIDSEDEVNEYLAEACESIQSASEQDIETDEEDFIVDDRINNELMREYQIQTTYNQAILAQINSGDYNLFQFFHKENKSPEMESYFNRYQIQLIDDEPQSAFPLPAEEVQDSQKKTKKISQLENHHIQNFLMFLWGKRESRQVLISLYKQVNPQLQRKALDKISKECTYKNQKGGGLLIKQEMIDRYDMSELLHQKVDPQAFFIVPESNNNDFLTGGTNLLNPKQSAKRTYIPNLYPKYHQLVNLNLDSMKKPKVFLTTPSKQSKKKLI